MRAILQLQLGSRFIAYTSSGLWVMEFIRIRSLFHVSCTCMYTNTIAQACIHANTYKCSQLRIYRYLNKAYTSWPAGTNHCSCERASKSKRDVNWGGRSAKNKISMSRSDPNYSPYASLHKQAATTWNGSTTIVQYKAIVTPSTNYINHFESRAIYACR